MSPIHFDPTVSYGTFLSVFSFLVVGFAGWWAFRSRVDTVLQNQKELMEALTLRFERHEERDEELFEKVQDKLQDVTVGIARLIGEHPSLRRRQDRATDHPR